MLENLEAKGKEEKSPLFKDVSEVRVFTNLSDCVLLLSDLGQKGQMGEVITSEVINPKESKDLGAIYSDDELLKSRTLRLFIQKGLVMEGRPPTDFKWPDTPKSILQARGKVSNEFTDPLKNEYDDRLLAVEQRDKKEDLETRMGAKEAP